MRLKMMCMECLKELGHPAFEFIEADYYEDAVCFIDCNRGHKSAVILQSLKFEILLESAAKALLSGYTLEAASSLSSAYERTVEFAVTVLSRKLGLDSETFTKTYKQMSKHSERQLGAFLILYPAVFGKEFQLSNKITEKRNKVIHQGRILSPDEVLEFGNLVYSDIKLITDKLRTLGNQWIDTVVQETMIGRYSSIPAGTATATTTGVTFFSLTNATNPDSFAQALEAFKKAELMYLEAQPHLDLLAATIRTMRPE